MKTPAPQRAAGRRALASKGLALKDGSFPVPNAAYWEKARRAIGRVSDPAKRQAVARLLRKTAPRFGKTAALKQSWAAGQSHANDQAAIELVGPKGYVHGWKYVGAEAHKLGQGAERFMKSTGPREPGGPGYGGSEVQSAARYTEVLDHMAAPRDKGGHGLSRDAVSRVGYNSRFLNRLHQMQHDVGTSPGHDHVPGSMGLGELIPGKTGTLLSNVMELASGPRPYSKGADETVQCPRCGKYDAPDARYCDQCGFNLVTGKPGYRPQPYDAAGEGKGEPVTCPYCHKGDAADARYCDQCGRKLPASAFADLSNPLEFAMPTHQPIRDPAELVIVRGEGGHSAIIRHRAGGHEIGQIRRDGRGWRASVGGRDLELRTHQRSALADVIGTHNKSALTAEHRPASDSAGPVLQPPAQQTPLMAQFGIPAIRTFATPTTSASAGPRMTSNSAGSDSDSDDSSGGLNAKGKQIYAKLKKRGFPDARALAFAKRAQNFGGSK